MCMSVFVCVCAMVAWGLFRIVHVRGAIPEEEEEEEEEELIQNRTRARRDS